MQKVNSENSGCLEDGIGNEYINSSIHEQFTDLVKSSTNLLKKKKSPKKMIPVVSPDKHRNNQSTLTKNKSKRQKINEKRERRKSFEMP